MKSTSAHIVLDVLHVLNAMYRLEILKDCTCAVFQIAFPKRIVVYVIARGVHSDSTFLALAMTWLDEAFQKFLAKNEHEKNIDHSL